MPPERAEPVANRYRKTLRGEVQEFEVKRGERTFAVTAVPVHHECGVIIAGMTMVYDVTAHKRVQEVLREQTLVFQSTLEHMREGVVMVNARGEFGVFNQAAKALLGAPPQAKDIADTLEKWRFFQADGVTPMPRHEEPLGKALRGEASSPTDVVLRTDDDAPAVHLHVTVDPIVDERNELRRHGGGPARRDGATRCRAVGARTSGERRALAEHRRGGEHRSRRTRCVSGRARSRVRVHDLAGRSRLPGAGQDADRPPAGGTTTIRRASQDFASVAPPWSSSSTSA